MEFLYNLISQGQTILGILVTAGLTYLLYMRLLRVNNFFDLSKQYTVKMGVMPLINKISIKDNKYYNRDTQQLVSEGEVVAISDLFNFFIHLGILYRMGLVDRKLTSLHFGNILKHLEKRRDLVDFVEKDFQRKNISYLIGKMRQRGKISSRFYLIKDRIKKTLLISKKSVS